MTVGQFLAVVEIKTKVVSVSTFCVALSYVYLRGGRPPAYLSLLLFLSVLLVDMGTTAWNSFFDYYKGVDRQDRESDKVLVHEAVAAGEVIVVALGLYALAGLIGLGFAFLRGWDILLLGGVSLLAGFFYSGGRKPISHSPLGEVFAGGFLGTVLFVVVQLVLADGRPSMSEWLWFSLPTAFHIAAILSVNNCCDLEADKIAGRKTLSIIVGRRASIILIILLVLTSYLLLIFFNLSAFAGLSPYGALIPAMALLPATIIFRRMLVGGFVQTAKGRSMGGISKIFLMHSLAGVATIWLPLLLPG